MISLLSLAAFIKRHWPNCRHWPRESLLPWIDWYRRHAILAISRHKNKIVGIVLGRILRNRDHWQSPYRHDPSGALIWIDLTIATHPRALAKLWCAVRNRFLTCHKIGFQRGDIFAPKRVQTHFYSLQKMDRFFVR